MPSSFSSGGLRALVSTVISFTVARSITLITSAYSLAPDALWFRPLVEVLIAVSTVYIALENIVETNNVRRRWMITFVLGLLHGFGFSFALRESLQLAGSHLTDAATLVQSGRRTRAAFGAGSDNSGENLPIDRSIHRALIDSHGNLESREAAG